MDKSQVTFLSLIALGFGGGMAIKAWLCVARKQPYQYAFWDGGLLNRGKWLEGPMVIALGVCASVASVLAVGMMAGAYDLGTPLIIAAVAIFIISMVGPKSTPPPDVPTIEP